MSIAALLLRLGPVALAAILFLPGCSGSSSSGNWQEFKSQKCRFSAQFPGDVEVEEVGADSQFQAVSDDAIFRVTCSRVPPLPEKAAMREFRVMCDGAAKSLDAIVEETRNTKVQGQPAIEFTLSFNLAGADTVSHTRYIRCQGRLYQQIVTTTAGTSRDQDIQKFFRSFQLETE